METPAQNLIKNSTQEPIPDKRNNDHEAGEYEITGGTPLKKKPLVKNTIDDGFRTYYEMSDGTWRCDGVTYHYRLEILGRMANALKDSTFIYFSNTKEISFHRAVMASGL
ncbi:hypothetical protein LY90DRAFT_511248 [Neocallimastix californiae]|uniref:Uncharacterized protein n=1 Tax=Neocallimastix californiae TaxID=1754190 RepID=A0A1Y2BRR5_9FUNG|nr:hypothetical protein LY90DRAFT_511248 [Neocallimastix californiae]|eukprot:ORY37317.1 hypothetical protein LY90DRAFT_511248 [Neocallimastix californiae]